MAKRRTGFGGDASLVSGSTAMNHSSSLRNVRFVRTPELKGCELSYVHSTDGAAPPDMRSLFEITLVDAADKTVTYRGNEQRIVSGLVGIRSPFEMGKLVRRHASETRVRTLALSEAEIGAAVIAAGQRMDGIPDTLAYLKAPRLFRSVGRVFSAVETNAAAIEIETLLMESASEVVRTLSGSSFPVWPRVDRPSARRIRQVLHDRVAEDVTLEELAQELSLSRAYVVHAFQRAFRVSPYEYLMHLRVERARLLLQSGWRPTEVAHACCFCDQSHLNRWFRKAIGMTPAQYSAVTRSSRRAAARDR
jgi:AraC-like DNA-binding protein